MRLPEYTNLTNNHILKGCLENSGSPHRPHTLSVKALEALSSPGDLIVCTVTQESHVVTSQDLSSLNPGLRPGRRHYTASLMELHGKVTVQRGSETTDDFGRLSDSLDTVVSTALTTLPSSKLLPRPLSPAGGREYVTQYTLLVLTSEELRPGDTLIYSGHGPRPSEFRVIDSTFLADNLQEVICRR